MAEQELYAKAACENPHQPDAISRLLQEMFAETAILLTHHDPRRSAQAKERVYALLYDMAAPKSLESQLSTLSNSLREAVEALRPFAREADEYFDTASDDMRPFHPFSLGQLRKVRDFLSRIDADGNGQ